jgi:peptidyl-tRNA hydrolase
MASAGGGAPSALVQYVLVRKDLKLGAGVIAAQVAHACVAAVWESRDSQRTQAYCAPGNIGSMHKVVLGVESLDEIERVASVLAAHSPPIAFYKWLEEPEMVTTALATAPFEQ